MRITSIKMRRYFPTGPLRAIMSIGIDNCLIIDNIKIIEKGGKEFVAMPGRKSKSGKYYDIVYPKDTKNRKDFEKIMLNAYAGYKYLYETSRVIKSPISISSIVKLSLSLSPLLGYAPV